MKEKTEFDGSSKKTFVNRVVALGTGAALLAGGCSVEKSWADKPSGSEPVDLVEEEVLNLEESYFDPIKEDIELDFFPSLTHNNYKYNFSPEVLKQIEKFHLEDGELKNYPFYRLTRCHPEEKILELVENFGKELNIEDEIHYDEFDDTVKFTVEEAIKIPGIEIDPRSPESIENGLENIAAKYFEKEDYNFKVINIEKTETEHYLIDFVRVEFDEEGNLELPHRRLYPYPPAVLDSEGKILSFSLPLIELEKMEDFRTEIISPKDFVKNIGTPNYQKIVNYKFPEEVQEIFMSSDGNLRLTGEEEGIINITDVELGIYVYDLSQGIRESSGNAPTVLIFKAEGFVKDPLDGSVHPSNFVIIGDSLYLNNTSE